MTDAKDTIIEHEAPNEFEELKAANARLEDQFKQVAGQLERTLAELQTTLRQRDAAVFLLNRRNQELFDDHSQPNKT